MNKEIEDEIFKTIKENNIFEFEKLISKVSELGEKVKILFIKKEGKKIFILFKPDKRIFKIKKVCIYIFLISQGLVRNNKIKKSL
jgi:hypothetical protein